MATGEKISKLPDGLPNIYAVIYQACNSNADTESDICRDDINGMNMEYIRRILSTKSECTFNGVPATQFLGTN